MRDALSALDRARDLTRKSLAAKGRRDREFIALITLHLIVIVGGAGALIQFEKHQAALDRINQEIAYHD